LQQTKNNQTTKNCIKEMQHKQTKTIKKNTQNSQKPKTAVINNCSYVWGITVHNNETQT